VGHAPVRASVLRNVAGGALAMALTYGAGSLVGERQESSQVPGAYCYVALKPVSKGRY
jgi:hypothetical protein